MAKRVSGAATIAKSAMLWLFVGVVFASTYGAVLSARDRSPASRLDAPGATILAAHEETAPN